MWDVGVERTVEVSRPRRRPADRHDHLPRPDEVRGQAGQVHARDRPRRLDRERPGAPARGREHAGGCSSPTPTPACTRSAWRRRAGSTPQVTLPDVHPMQVQGPMSAKTLEKLVGPAIYDIKYYWIEEFDIDGIPVVISRTGWTAIPGLRGEPARRHARATTSGTRIAAAGEEFDIRPIAPCEARRIEAGIFNYGSDIRLGDTPLPRDGARAARRAAAAGLHRQGGPGGAARRRASTASSSASSSRATSCARRCRSTGTSRPDGEKVGHMTDAVWSPGPEEEHRLRLGARSASPSRAPSSTSRPRTGDHIVGTTAAIPFVDPRKERPAGVAPTQTSRTPRPEPGISGSGQARTRLTSGDANPT